MTIIIAGKNSIAVDVLNFVLKKTDCEVFVIFNKTESFKNSFQKSLGFFSKLWKIKSISIEDAYEIDDLVFLSLEYDRIIKPKLFKSKKLYNIHFSLLPAYKGMYTSSHPILNNEKLTGVTFHLIDKGIDTGDIIFQKKIKISNTDNSRDLYKKYIDNGTKLICKNFFKILEGNFTVSKQSYLNSSYYSLNSINFKDIKIDFNNTAFGIVNQIRAYSFYEYQLPKFQDHEIIGYKILDSKSSLSPSKVIKNEESFIKISTVDYDLKLYINMYEKMWNACRINDHLYLEKLLKLDNIELDFKSVQGWNAIIIAVYNSSLECVKLLLKNEADINSTNYNSTNLLMYAINSKDKSKRLKLIEILLSKGARILEKDIYGKTVIDWLENDKGIINFIKKYL